MIHRPKREGISLLEVLISVTILSGSVLALASLISLANERARMVEEQSIAMRLAQSKMAEANAGIIPLTSQGFTPFDSTEAPPESEWEWSIDAETGDYEGLWTVTITVRAGRSITNLPPVTLTKMMIDPLSRGTTLDEAKIAGEEDTGEDTEGGTME